jgi:large subunit ribosomal protein L5
VVKNPLNQNLLPAKFLMTTPFLKQTYRDEIVPAMLKSHGFSNTHQVPRLDKIVVNSGFSADIEKSSIDDLRQDIAAITGQQPVITRARLSISNFKVRQDMPLGIKVTLRGNNMYEFLHRLIAIALPNIRDFRGLPDKFDGQGNYTLGITDHTIFPEMHIERQRTNVGMDISFVTNSSLDKEGRDLMVLFGMPFRKPSAIAA